MAQQVRTSGVIRNVPKTVADSVPRGGLRFDWMAITLSTWLIGGVFLDGWAHGHVGRLETFFTPWHAVLYSGYLVLAAFLALTALRNRLRGATWPQLLPVGYGVSLAGAALFGVGGVLDLIWHTLFGIERSVAALVSPTHLLLASGALLMVTGPLRAAWARSAAQSRVSWREIAPALLSLTYVLCLLTFFTQYAHPITKSYADVATDFQEVIGLGLASIVLQTVILMSVMLFAVRRWRLPLGSFALLLGINYAGSSILAESSPVLKVAVLGAFVGILIDVLNVNLRPGIDRPINLRVFALAVPILLYSIYFLALAQLHGVAWSIHLWFGSIVEAGLIGLLLSYLLVPPHSPSSSAASD